MTKYTRKPVIVEAVQWTGKNVQEMNDFGVIVSLVSLEPGAYIVRDEKDKYIVHTKERFHELYKRQLVWEDNI